MDDIELDNINKGREEERSGQDREREETSFTERTEETKDDYDNIRSRINSGSTTQRETNEGLDKNDLQNIEERIKRLQDKSLKVKRNAIEALESATGVRFDVSHGDKSKYLISKISDAKYSEKDNRLIALKFDGKDVILTKEGKINKTATVQNRKIWEAIAAANEEYEGTADAVVDEGAGFSVSDDARESVRGNVIERTEANMQEIVDEIEERDLNKNLMREVRGIMRADKYVEYDNLEDPNQKQLFNDKIKSLRDEAERYKELRENERDPTKKILYQAARDLSVMKEINMKMKANEKPESELGQNMIEEETDANDLTRFERFKKWAKENLVGVSAIAISVAGIITTVVISGRNAVKKGAKAVGQFGKALANLAKKAGPAIATILNILAQVLTWGAKALEFLSRNLWIVALFLTYLVYDTVKGRIKSKN